MMVYNVLGRRELLIQALSNPKILVRKGSTNWVAYLTTISFSGEEKYVGVADKNRTLHIRLPRESSHYLIYFTQRVDSQHHLQTNASVDRIVEEGVLVEGRCIRRSGVKKDNQVMELKKKGKKVMAKATERFHYLNLEEGESSNSHIDFAQDGAFNMNDEH